MFKELSDYILLEIFSYFSKKELLRICSISKRWNRLCFDRYLWQEIIMDEFSCVDIEDHMISNFIQHAKSITKLSLRGCYQVSNKVLKDISLCGMKLNHLNLENCFKITDRGIVTIARHCSQLRVVNVANTVITDFGLCYMIKENKKLIDLTAHPSAVTEKTVAVLAENCQQLETLHVELSDYNPPLSKFHRNKQAFSQQTLSSSMIECLAKNCQLLQVLIMKYYVTNVSDSSMACLGYYCKRLECLEIGHAENITILSDAGIVKLCLGLTSLQRLELTETYITDLSLYIISHNCPNLEHLSIKNNGPISDIGILHLMMGCRNLESFCLQSGMHSHITNWSIFAIAQSVCSYNLIKLSLEFWGITDFGLLELARNLPNLMYLSVKGCKHLTHVGLKETLRFFNNLESLNLAFTKCIKTDDELYELSEKLPKTFQSISLEIGNGISEKGCNKFQSILPDCELIFCH